MNKARSTALCHKLEHLTSSRCGLHFVMMGFSGCLLVMPQRAGQPACVGTLRLFLSVQSATLRAITKAQGLACL